MYFCNINQKKSWYFAWQTQRHKAIQRIISVKLVSGIFLIVTTAQSCLSPDIHYKVCCWWPGKSQRCATSTFVLLALLGAVPGFFVDCRHICYYLRSRVHIIQYYSKDTQAKSVRISTNLLFASEKLGQKCIQMQKISMKVHKDVRKTPKIRAKRPLWPRISTVWGKNQCDHNRRDHRFSYLCYEGSCPCCIFGKN